MTKELNSKIEQLKKDISFQREESQALYLEIKQQRSLNDDHQKLNGKLRIEIESLNKEIKKLKKEAKEMYEYP